MEEAEVEVEGLEIDFEGVADLEVGGAKERSVEEEEVVVGMECEEAEGVEKLGGGVRVVGGGDVFLGLSLGRPKTAGGKTTEGRAFARRSSFRASA